MSKSNQLTGVIKSIGKTIQVSDKFSKREMVLTTDLDTNYPQQILLQFTQKNCDKLDNLKSGERVTVSYNLKGRLWTGADGVEKCFTTIEGWSVELASKSADTFEMSKDYNEKASKSDLNDDLPF